MKLSGISGYYDLLFYLYDESVLIEHFYSHTNTNTKRTNTNTKQQSYRQINTFRDTWTINNVT